jgi:hypothetical protein
MQTFRKLPKASPKSTEKMAASRVTGGSIDGARCSEALYESQLMQLTE